MFESIKKYPLFFAISSIVVIITVVLLILLNLGRDSLIQVVKVTPQNNEDRVALNGKIIITFQDRLPQEKAVIKLNPEISGSYEIKSGEKNVVLTPNSPFKPYTTYTATLILEDQQFLNPENTINTSYTWKFQTDREAYGEESFNDEPQEIREFQETMKRASDAFTRRKERLPFIILLPYATDHFRITISAVSDTVTITTYGNTRAEHLTYRNEALNWIRSNGGNTQNFSIIYDPASP